MASDRSSLDTNHPELFWSPEQLQTEFTVPSKRFLLVSRKKERKKRGERNLVLKSCYVRVNTQPTGCPRSSPEATAWQADSLSQRARDSKQVTGTWVTLSAPPN